MSEEERTEAGVCPSCDGMGWINHGWIAGPAVGGVTLDVMLADWRRCARCSGSGVFVSRERAGVSRGSDADQTRT